MRNRRPRATVVIYFLAGVMWIIVSMLYFFRLRPHDPVFGIVNLLLGIGFLLLAWRLRRKLARSADGTAK